MKTIKYFLLALVCVAFASCKTNKHEFPLDKRYWDPNDYDKAILELRYAYEGDEKLPTFDDPETRLIVEKLVDEQNFNVVLDDTELGLKHKSEVAQEFFDQWKDMTHIYEALDRKDQYVYDKELLAVWQFGLGLQLKYFKLGNDKIKEGSDDPNSTSVRNTLNSNVSTLVNNYLIYLDEINNENAFTEDGKAKFADGIDKYFSELIHVYNGFNFSELKNKATLMIKKTKSDKIKSSLTKLVQLIDSKKPEANN